MKPTHVNLGSTDFVLDENNGSFFHENLRCGESILHEDEATMISNLSKIKCIAVGSTPRVTLTTSIKELEKLLKLAKATKNKYKFPLFLKYLSPDVCIMFKESKKKLTKKRKRVKV